jgi:hypothetical protein
MRDPHNELQEVTNFQNLLEINLTGLWENRESLAETNLNIRGDSQSLQIIENYATTGS